VQKHSEGDRAAGVNLHSIEWPAQSWTWVGFIHGLGWVGSKKMDPRPTLGQRLVYIVIVISVQSIYNVS